MGPLEHVCREKKSYTCIRNNHEVSNLFFFYFVKMNSMPNQVVRPHEPLNAPFFCNDSSVVDQASK